MPRKGKKPAILCSRCGRARARTGMYTRTYDAVRDRYTDDYTIFHSNVCTPCADMYLREYGDELHRGALLRPIRPVRPRVARGTRVPPPNQRNPFLATFQLERQPRTDPERPTFLDPGWLSDLTRYEEERIDG